jgi:putative transposase
MPRKIRELADGGIYHIYNRRNHGADLFCDPQDFECFRYLLRRSRRKYASEVYHYCLMPNHFHILIRIGLGRDLAPFMHLLQLSYARYWQRKYQLRGHVFQERYRSPRIEGESYYLQCGRYIERNPSRAKIVMRPEEYPYSSARYYILGVKDPIVTPNLYYQTMGKTDQERSLRYRQFLSFDDPYVAVIEKSLRQG